MEAAADLPEEEMSGINLIWIREKEDGRRKETHASGKEDQ